jgi:hypothetical protein
MLKASGVKIFLRELYNPEHAEIESVPEIRLVSHFPELIAPPKGIVAVHGLNPTNTGSHAEMTWTAHNQNMWLKDFLPKKLPTARILLFGYNANVAFETSTAGVREQAENLLNRLKGKRKVRIAKFRSGEVANWRKNRKPWIGPSGHNCWAAGSSPWGWAGRAFPSGPRYKPMWLAPKANIV